MPGNSQTFANVIRYLEQNPVFQEEKRLGKTKILVSSDDSSFVVAPTTPQQSIPPALDEDILLGILGKNGITSSSDVNTPSTHEHLRTALIEATQRGNLRLVRALVNHGADPSVADSSRTNAIMYAAELGDTEILKEFLSLISNEEKPHDKPEDNPSKISGEKESSAEPLKEKKAEALLDPAEGNNEEQRKSKKQTTEVSLFTRVNLPPGVLKEQNSAKQTAETLLQAYLEKQKKLLLEKKPAPERRKHHARRSTPLKSRPGQPDLVVRFKILVDEVCAVKTALSLLMEKPRHVKVTAGPPRAPQKSPELEEKLDVANRNRESLEGEERRKQKESEFRHRYDGFFARKLHFFSHSLKKPPVADALKEAAQKRENLRKSSDLIILHTESKESPENLRQLSKRYNNAPILIIRSIGQGELHPKRQYSIYSCISHDPRKDRELMKKMMEDPSSPPLDEADFYNWGITPVESPHKEDLEDLEYTPRCDLLVLPGPLTRQAEENARKRNTPVLVKEGQSFYIYGSIEFVWQKRNLNPLTTAEERERLDELVLAAAEEKEPLSNSRMDKALLAILKKGHAEAAVGELLNKILEKTALDKPHLIQADDRAYQSLLRLALPLSHQPMLFRKKLTNSGEPVNLSIPTLPDDRATVHAALALLKDYYAPESAPVFRCLDLAPLRRLLTCHLGRRYCQRAEKIYKKLLENLSLENVEAFKTLHATLDKERREIEEKDHDRGGKNDTFNSSYTRRLHYILRSIEATQAYKIANTKDKEEQQEKVDRYLLQL